MNLRDFDTLTFDCYGTLIDWETGLLRAVLAHLPGAARPDEEILETYARLEAEAEVETPSAPYPEILARVHGRLAETWGLAADAERAAAFGASVGEWPAFEDSAEALRVLKRHYRLVILSNIDRDSFRASEERLGVRFDHVFTAQEIGSYKPDPRNFEWMLGRLAEVGVEKERILHTAQSLYHDHVPASRLGLATCWIDRRHDRPGWGATPAPPGDVRVDFRFPSLAAMVGAVEAERVRGDG